MSDQNITLIILLSFLSFLAALVVMIIINPNRVSIKSKKDNRDVTQEICVTLDKKNKKS